MDTSNRAGRAGEPSFPKEPGGAADQVYTELRRAIISGDHAPGSRLVENQLAKTLAVSRTPVRAALARLASDGLVTSIHNRSAVVSTWSEESLDEIYALRLMLEGHAAELAANHATPSDADHLQSLATQMDERGSGRKAGYAEACAELNAQFHLSLVEASKSERLIKIASGLIELPLVRQAILARPWDEVLGSWSQHHMIVAAIRDHNGALAAALVRAHLLAGQNGLRRTLQTNGGRTAR